MENEVFCSTSIKIKIITLKRGEKSIILTGKNILSHIPTIQDPGLFSVDA